MVSTVLQAAIKSSETKGGHGVRKPHASLNIINIRHGQVRPISTLLLNPMENSEMEQESFSVACKLCPLQCFQSPKPKKTDIYNFLLETASYWAGT
jgi:hypothetical protein